VLGLFPTLDGGGSPNANIRLMTAPEALISVSSSTCDDKLSMGVDRKADDTRGLPPSWILLAFAAVLLRFCFWSFTSRVWEDALISVLHSENVFRGIGMTHFHRNGIPVHGFTSPISVLIPLVGDSIRVGCGLTLIRVFSAFASGIAVLTGMSIARQLGLSRFLVWIAGAYLAFEYHQILWGMSGMETQLVTTILLVSIWSLNNNVGAVRTGLMMALCILARPDFLVWVGIMCAVLLWRWYKDRNQNRVWGGITVLVIAYAPWLVFTTVYYGSPIPNTILAKSVGYPLWTTRWPDVPTFLGIMVVRAIKEPFAPLGLVYGGNGTGFYSLDGYTVEFVAAVLVLLGIAISFHRKDRLMIPTSLFLVAYSFYYIFLVPTVCGWYCVPTCATAMLAVLYAIQHAAPPHPFRRNVAYVALAAYVVALVGLLPIEFRSERNIQIYVENGVRKQMALYLRRHSSPNATIGLEPLGYMSYYSGREIYDYPGLVNRETVRLLKTYPDRRRLDHMLKCRRPDWIVLRRKELNDLFYGHPENDWLKDSYVPVNEFTVDGRFFDSVLASRKNIDTDFFVFRKVLSPLPAAAGTP